eukprot:316726-Hanusia_phi.AAC.1
MAVLNGGINESDMRVPNIVVNATVALLTSVSLQLKISEKASRFNQLALKFDRLEASIEQAINQNEMTAERMTTFVSSYDLLLEQCENFPAWIKDRVKNTSTGLHLPYILGNTPNNSFRQT